MKKIITIISAFALSLALTGCSSAPADEFANLKLVDPVISSDKLYSFDNLETLEDSSEIAVVGTFVKDAAQQEFYETLGSVQILKNIISINTIRVSKVIKGDIAVGDELNIIQRYGIINDELIVFDGLTPMQKGDEWVFFLRKEPALNGYWCRGNTDGRFPTRNVKSNRAFSLSEYSELGVYDEADFKWDIYNELVEKYDI